MRWRFLWSLWLFSSVAPAAFGASDPAARLGVPSGIARWVDSANLQTGRLPEFLLIQDIHDHAEAQGQIAALLLYGRHRWGIRRVYLEGLFAGLEARSNRLEEAPGAAVRAGRLSGPELAAEMLGRERFRLLGMESRALYERNLQAYQDVRRLQPGALQRLRARRIVTGAFDAPSPETDALERLVRLKLTPERYAALRSRAPRFQDPVLQQAVTRALDYYAAADARSDAFFQAIDRQALQPDEMTVLVLGGFHTARIAETLRQAGRSFAVLAPRVTAAGDRQGYEDRLEETLNALRLRDSGPDSLSNPLAR
jgi:hypothetical protein